MIYNRTFADINNVKQILKKIKQFVTLTESEKQTLERGTFTINTMNRIETAQEMICEKLVEWNYLNKPIYNKTNWTESDIFTKSDLERIVNNTIVLRNAFDVIAQTIANPTAKYSYEDVNAMEQILEELQKMLDIVQKTFQISGTFYSGQRNLLPIN